jgi:hypothetical protein
VFDLPVGSWKLETIGDSRCSRAGMSARAAAFRGSPNLRRPSRLGGSRSQLPALRPGNSRSPDEPLLARFRRFAQLARGLGLLGEASWDKASAGVSETRGVHPSCGEVAGVLLILRWFYVLTDAPCWCVVFFTVSRIATTFLVPGFSTVRNVD